ncbi:MAG: hypothetical protein ABW128_14160 [Rhizorhabdus sp.]
MKLMIAAAAASGVLAGASASAGTVSQSDKQWSSEGSYMAFASPWCSYIDKTLDQGTDYLDTVTYTAGDLATGKNIQLKWRWPALAKRSPACGVFGYDQVAWGNYDGGRVMSPIAPRQVLSIKTLSLSHDITESAEDQEYNGLAEFYLTKEPGAANLKAIEIGWFWNAPAATVAWAATGRQLGTFSDRYSRKWTVSVNKGGASGTFVTFIPSGKLLAGTFDAKAAIDFLRDRGLVNGAWWFNGAAIGVEPLGNSGSALIRKFTVTAS